MKGNYPNGGYTLLEALLVLSIISVLLSVTVLKLSATYQKQIGLHFTQQLSNDLMFAQQYAMSTKSSVYIIFTPTQNYYRIRQGTVQITELVRREYHADISIDTRTMGERITYHGNGSITKSGVISIAIEGTERYVYVFTLGKGRFYVETL